LSLLVVIAHRSPRGVPPAPGGTGTDARARPWALVGLVAVYGQIVLGAAVRHLGAGLSCIDLPGCQGRLWPEDFLAQLHMSHRVFACVATAAALAAAWQVWRSSPVGSSARRVAATVPFWVAIQVTLGILSVTSVLGLYEVTAHLVGGGVLLISMVSLVLHTARAPVGTVVPAAPEPAEVV
jgi:cytochrome c oxidase assembly protein subunit 15